MQSTKSLETDRWKDRQKNRQTDMVSAHTKLLKRQTDTKKQNERGFLGFSL